MIHPETGEVLETREQFQAALAGIEERMAPLYQVRRALRDGRAEMNFQAIAFPPARSRTPTQDRVARCPRCGSKLKDGDSDVGFGEATEK